MKDTLPEAIARLHEVSGCEQGAQPLDVVGLHGIHLVVRVGLEVLVTEFKEVGFVHDPLGGVEDDILAAYQFGDTLRTLEYYRPDEGCWTEAQIELDRRGFAKCGGNR